MIHVRRLRIVFCVLFLFTQAALGVQTWIEEPRYTEVNPGDDALLACKIHYKKGACYWQKDGKAQGMFVGKIEWAGEQDSGDCSLRVLNASAVDDGHWECQVTASSFSANDALTSQVAKLVVRVAPDPPELELGSSGGAPGGGGSSKDFRVRVGAPSSIKCLSRGGNPAPRIKWFLGSEELPSSSYNQTNATELSSQGRRPETWVATSVLTTSFAKADHGRALRCVTVHEAFAAKSKDVSVPLDVQYSPTVTLQGSPAGDIEEGEDRVTLQCLADANPPANIIWKRVGEDNVFSFQETVEFNPVTRKHSGTYTCKASNVVGVSDPLSLSLDVKYPPKILEVGPEPVLTASLNNRTSLQCQAKGDPVPSYEWFQVTPTGRKIRRGESATLVIDPVSYEHQGQYFCLAYNVIKGDRKDDHSTPVIFEVMGAPQVLRYTVEQEVVVDTGDDAVIQMVFCSDPEPLRIAWEWGSFQLDAGNGKGRFVAERIAQEPGSQDCYQSTLRIQHVLMTDARNYYLNVQNEKGADKYEVTLIVKEPVTMSTIIGIVIACVVVLVIVTIIVFCAFKTEKCCFAPRSDFKTTDVENRKTDSDYQKNSHGFTGPNGNSAHTNGDGKVYKDQLQQSQQQQQDEQQEHQQQQQQQQQHGAQDR